MRPIERLDGIVFDKDGTLFDFQRTWGNWARGALRQLAEGDEALFLRLSAAVGFDPEQGIYHPDSPAIAGTNGEIADLIAAVLPARSARDVLAELNRLACHVPLAEAVPIAPLLRELGRSGLRLAVATNDTEEAARTHLAACDALELVHQVYGYDSGHGAKPEPGMLTAFCAMEGLAPDRIAIVGDSTHDLLAGRAAGAVTIGVLTGPASARDLSPLADVVLPDIGHLPAWLNMVSAGASRRAD